MPNLLSEKTMIPVSLVMTLIGGVAWLTSIKNTQSDQGDQLVKLQRTVENQSSVMSQMDVRLARIEGKLGVKE